MTKLTIKEVLPEVDKLIKSGKYTKTESALARTGCKRCYLGLIAQVLVDKGYYEWREFDCGGDTKLYLELTPVGAAAGFEKTDTIVSIDSIDDLPYKVHYPLSYSYEGEELIPVWKLNDQLKLSFEETHAAVCNEVKRRAKSNDPNSSNG
jgi:hypothetical protein